MNGMVTKSAVMLVVLLATAGLGAGEPKADPADVKALHELHQAYVAAFNKGDAEAVAALYAPDGDNVRPAGQMTKGRAEIEKGYANFFAQNKRSAKLDAPFASLRFITRDVAIADRPAALTPAPEGGPRKVHVTVVYVKRDGKWLIASNRVMVPFQSSGH
jgi:uncharacterized protein (TIGR02246 family)